MTQSLTEGRGIELVPVIVILALFSISTDMIIMRHAHTRMTLPMFSISLSRTHTHRLEAQLREFEEEAELTENLILTLTTERDTLLTRLSSADNGNSRMNTQLTDQMAELEKQRRALKDLLETKMQSMDREREEHYKTVESQKARIRELESQVGNRSVVKPPSTTSRV